MEPESVEQERHALCRSICCIYRRLESRWTWEHGAEGSKNQAIYGAMKTTLSDSHGDIQGESRLRKVSLSQSLPSAQSSVVYLVSGESCIWYELWYNRLQGNPGRLWVSTFPRPRFLTSHRVMGLPEGISESTHWSPSSKTHILNDRKLYRDLCWRWFINSIVMLLIFQECLWSLLHYSA